MTRDDDFIGQLEGYLDEYEGITPLPAAVRDAIQAELPSTRQIGLHQGPIGYLHTMSKPLQFSIAAAALVLAAVLGFNYISNNVGSNLPTPNPSPPGTPVPLPSHGALDPGTYSLDPSFPVGITFQVPAGWDSCSHGPEEQGVCLSMAGGPRFGVGFLIVANVVADPCVSALRDPPVGPSIDDLVLAISRLEGFEATAAVDVSVDGFQGKQFTVTAADDAVCLQTWATADRVNGVGNGEANLVQILDVNGVRVVITAAYFPSDTSAAELSALMNVIDSVQIEP